MKEVPLVMAIARTWALAWHGLAQPWSSTQRTHAQNDEDSEACPGGYPHGRGCKPTRHNMASPRIGPDKTITVPRDTG